MADGLLLLGGGGHCCAVLDSLLSDPNCPYGKIAVVDAPQKRGGELFPGVPFVGSDDDLPRLRAAGFAFAFVTVGSVGDPSARIRLTQMAERYGYTVPTIVDPTAVVGKNVRLGSGVYVGKRAVLNFGCTVGDGSILNTGCIVEHQCAVGSFCHIAPGAVLCGGVRVGDGAHIGAGSTVLQGVCIGAGALVGLGSAVVRDIPDRTVAYGNPCTPRRTSRAD